MDHIRAIWVYPSQEEEGAEQKSCPRVDQGSMGRDTPRIGQQILQDLRYFQCQRTEDDAAYSVETPEVDDKDIEENEFETESETETDGE